MYKLKDIPKDWYENCSTVIMDDNLTLYTSHPYRASSLQVLWAADELNVAWPITVFWVDNRSNEAYIVWINGKPYDWEDERHTSQYQDRMRRIAAEAEDLI